MKKMLRRVREVLRKRNHRAHIDLRLVLQCPVQWEEMRPTKQPDRRHCTTCSSDVLDLLGKSKAEVLAILKASGPQLCAQVYARGDGRVVFGPCEEAEPLVMRGGLGLSV